MILWRRVSSGYRRQCRVLVSDVLRREWGWCAQAWADAPERVVKVAVGVGVGTKLNAPSSSWALCSRSTA
jgi:hypothetical protein